MKYLKAIACLAMVLAALVYAGTWSDFGINVKTKAAYDVNAVTNDAGIWLVATGGTDADKIQFLGGTTPNTHILLDKVGAVSAKGITDVGTIAVGTLSGAPADGTLASFFAVYQPAGGPKGVAFKLKGVTIGTVLAGTLKGVSAAAIGNVAGSNPKGSGIAAVTRVGGLFGAPGNEKYAYIGVGGANPIATTVKGLKCKGTAGDVMLYAAPAKPGSTKISAKGGALGDGVMANNPADWSPKSSPAVVAPVDPTKLPF